MRRRHLRRVITIESRVYPRPWSGSLFLSELTQRGTRSYLVAKHRGDVVGYAGMMFTGFEAHVTNIAVDPDWHGLKIGSRLLLSLVTEAIARGSTRISLEVRVSNGVAQSMYEKFGFEVAGTRQGLLHRDERGRTHHDRRTTRRPPSSGCDLNEFDESSDELTEVGDQ